jgi:menaquinone-dependent protoporphyrinogen oxidase
VCGAESAAEGAATPEARAAAAKHVGEQLSAFAETTGWHPARVVPVAGALLYTHYNPLVRWMMKKIAKSEAMPTDTSKDYEFTNWGALDEVARKLAEEVYVG